MIARPENPAASRVERHELYSESHAAIDARRVAEKAIDWTEERIRVNPGMALVTAAAVGLVFGWLLKWRR